ncbi:MAG: nucleotide exchange factor GrpE [Anaerolineales bacterium]|jgi:molecular chaperone GrpE
MSKKEKSHQTEIEAKNAPESATTPEPGPESERNIGQEPSEALEPETSADLSNSVDELEKRLAEAQAQAAEYKDGWQRSVADFQNYKRRVDAEKNETYQNAIGSVIKRYLPILDDLERALSTRPADLAWVDGIELIYRKLKSILEAEGLKRIEAEGQMFDPNFHEAILQESCDGYESGQVIAVVQNGYTLGDRVIRPAQVRVAQ